MDLQNTTQKNKNWATRIPQKTGDELEGIFLDNLGKIVVHFL